MLDPYTIVTALGIHPPEFVIGLMFAGLRATSMGELNDRKKAGAAIVFSALVAGIAAVPAASVAHSRLVPELSIGSLSPVIALILGVFSPAAVKYGIAFLKRKEGEKP